jgi:pyridoxine 5-phosphate synthase
MQRKLNVNIDHIATLRQARLGIEPDPVHAAALVELAGAHGITVHLREDRRHINDRDVRILRQTIKTKLNLEMAATDEMIKIAGEIKPEWSTLVPEKRQELTTEGGLNAKGLMNELTASVQILHDNGILVSLFIDPDMEQVDAARRIGADFIEIHTGTYANTFGTKEEEKEFRKVAVAAERARDLGLRVNAGHGLNYINMQRMVEITEIEEFSIGHSIISRAVFTGLDAAVRDMLALLK